MKQLVVTLCAVCFIPLLGTQSLAAKSNPIPSIFASSQQVIYKNNSLYLYNFSGIGTVEVYTIIGKKITQFKNQSLEQAEFVVSLDRQNLYIVRIITADGTILTFKIVAD